MEIWSEIRREVLTGALSKRAAIAKYGIGWHTLKKMLAHDEPPGYRQAKHRPKHKLEAFLPVIRQVFVERRPVQPERRDFDPADIFLGSGFQPRIALGGKTHLMAAPEPDKDHSSLVPCLQGTVSQGARSIFV
jgi:hypothetical protein